MTLHHQDETGFQFSAFIKGHLVSWIVYFCRLGHVSSPTPFCMLDACILRKNHVFFRPQRRLGALHYHRFHSESWSKCTISRWLGECILWVLKKNIGKWVCHELFDDS